MTNEWFKIKRTLWKVPYKDIRENYTQGIVNNYLNLPSDASKPKKYSSPVRGVQAS